MKQVYLTMLLLSLPLTTAISMGVSPPRVIMNNLLPGSRVQEIIVVSKSSEQEITIQTNMHGSAQQWIEHPKEIIFAQEMRDLRVPLDIHVPQNIELGNYSATINYFVAGESNLHMAFSVHINLTVSKLKDSNYQIKHIRASQDNKTTISFEVHNKGNVLSGPTIAQIEIIDNANKNRVYKTSKKVQKTEPFSITKKTIELDAEIPNGYYWVKILLKDENQKYEETVFLEAQNNKITGQVSKEIQNKNAVYQDKLGFAMILLIVFAIYLIGYYLKKRGG